MRLRYVPYPASFLSIDGAAHHPVWECPARAFATNLSALSTPLGSELRKSRGSGASAR